MAKTAISVLRKAMPGYTPSTFTQDGIKFYRVPETGIADRDGMSLRCDGCVALTDTIISCADLPTCRDAVFIRATVEAAEQYVIRRVTAALEGNS